MCQAQLAPLNRQQHFERLLHRSRSTPNQQWLAQILASWLSGDGVLPDFLGLEIAQFEQMTAYCFADHAIDCHAVSGSHLDFARMLEKQDLEQFLRRFAKPHPESEWIIAIIVAACLGNDHLWQDLGLWGRKELSALLTYNFPELSARNTKDMKWKKFIYKQLCEAEGLYVCRAPSCEVCQDYPQCFGKEE